jgi:hypothetical protein
MPTTTNISLSQALELAKIGEKQKALAVLRKIIQQQPDHVQAHLYLGRLTPSPQESLQAFEHVLRLHPDNAAAKKGIQTLFERQPSQDTVPSAQDNTSSSNGRIWRGTQIVTLAGNVTWPFRDLNRPLAEVLHSGEVKQRDLGWASWNAYDPVVKWAAAVRLKADTLRTLKLRASEAKKVIWPFRDINQPMGALLTTHTINLHDLAYAVAQAYDAKVRNAAAVLGAQIVQHRVTPKSAKEKETPAPKAAIHAPQRPTVASRIKSASAATTSKSTKNSQHRKEMQVIEGSDYLAQEERKKARGMVILAVAVLVLWGASLVISLGATILNLFRQELVPLKWSIAAAFFLFSAKFWLPKLENTIDEHANYDRGLRGELRVAMAFKKRLDDRWTLFRNLILNKDEGDIDAVLVGPSGVYLLEIKAYTSYYKNNRKRWQRKYLGAWRDLNRSPSQQALHNARRLHTYLAEHGVKVWVEPRIVWASRSKLWLQKPAVPVWQLTKAQFIAEDLMQGKGPSDEERRQIFHLLTKRCAASRKQ